MGYLTKENLDQIRIYLGKTGVKDSQFEELNTLTGLEYMTLVSDTGNKKIRTSALKTIFTGEGTSTTGGIQTVNTKTDLDNFTSKGYGNLVYVKDEDLYYSYSSTESWELVTKIYIGTLEPTDKTVLWFNNGTTILSNGLNNTSIITVYRWDQTSLKWIIVCSNSALGIKTTNSKLLNQGELVISIDEALERIKELVISNDEATKVILDTFNSLGTRVSSVESSITQLANLIATKVDLNDFNSLGIRVSTAESNITLNAASIATKVSLLAFDALGTRVATAETSIVLNTNSIALKVSQTDFNALGQRVSTAETSITANSNAISLHATNINDLTGRVSDAEIKITPDAINLAVKSQVDSAYDNAVNYTNSLIAIVNNSIRLAVSSIQTGGDASLYVTKTEYNAEITILQDSISSKVSQTDFNALGTIVETAESNITQNANNIALKVSQTDFNALGGRVGTAESTITQHSTAIASKVSQTTFNALGTRVSTAESTITQHATDIDLRVTKDGVIGAINLTSEAATIKASKINLIGAVTFSSFDSSTKATINGKADSAAHGNFTYIDGSSVYTGTLTANQVNAVGISANSITTGTLSADRINSVDVVTRGLVAQTVHAATLQTIHNSGEAYIDIHQGIMDVYGTVARNIQFGVNDQGMAVLKYFDNDGFNLYDLGPNGLDTKNLQTAQWLEIQYVRVLDIMQTIPPEGLVSDEDASVLFRLNTTWGLTTLYKYLAGKINNTIVSDSANGFTTAAEAAAANDKLFTARGAGHLANDTYTKNNAGAMYTDNISKEVSKQYWVIQNGVPVIHSWRCSLDTFRLVNGIVGQGPGGLIQ